jgi:uncharacterized protein YyaL (SSP411 family)
VVVGEGETADALLDVARKSPHAMRIVLRAPNGEALAADHPAQAKVASLTGSAAFVCRGQTCSLPVTSAETLRDLL